MAIFSDDTFRHFFPPEHMKEKIIQTFQEKIFALDKNGQTYEARKEYFENKMDEELDAVEFFEKSSRRKRKFRDIDGKIEECSDPRKTRMVVEFNNHKSASIKSFAVNKQSIVKVATRFMSGKLLMFAKLSLKSFIYDLLKHSVFQMKL